VNSAAGCVQAERRTARLRIVQRPVVPANPTKFVLASRVAADHVIAPFILFYGGFALQNREEA
jgi:hypothetical protein